MSKKWLEIHPILHTELVQAINSLNFPTMTPIQAAGIPQLINRKDVVAEAVTGSGKTLAFLIPVLEILKRRETPWKKHEIGALIISPTRELALQIDEVLQQLLVHVTGVTHLLLIGGATIDHDLSQLNNQGGNIVICTPGRFDDLLSRKQNTNLPQKLKQLEVLILDEADRLLDLGFQSSVNSILGYLPKQRRTALFSATQTKQVENLIRAGLRNPVLVSVNAGATHSTPDSLHNYYVNVTESKPSVIVTFLERVQKGLLFLPTCAMVDYWAMVLPHLCQNVTVVALHGKMKHKRHFLLSKFKKLPRALLVCTDVLARGIDIEEVDWVLQWDPPSNAAAFVHRVGRTARQGRQGSSVIFLGENEIPYVHFIEHNQRVRLDQLTVDSSDSGKVRTKLHELARNDRDVMEKATRAFVSHVRAYSKHECSLLLKVTELDLVGLANAYGLLRLPSMPELKDRDLSAFQTIEINIDEIPYKNKDREKARQRKVAELKRDGTKKEMNHHRKKPKQNESWSMSKVNKKENRKKDKEKKKKKTTASVTEIEWEELKRDIATMKQLKRRKITEEECDKRMGIDV